MKNTFLGYEDIIVKNFYKISETGNLRWFYKDYDGIDKKELKKIQTTELSARFKQIFIDRID